MLSINKQRTSENLLYILVWSAIFFVPALNTAMTSRDQIYIEEVLAAWFKTGPFFVIYLINNNYLAPILLVKRLFFRYIAAICALSVLIFVGVDYIQDNLMIRFMARRVVPDLVPGEISITDLSIFWNVVLAVLMCSANDGIKLMYKSMRDDQMMEELKRQNLQIEMDYLKYQVNPHFFMNTLNNIHALIDIDTESAKSTVIELSKMMRYVLYKSGSESISLNTDITFINNYIELMRIRYDESIHISFDQSDNRPTNAAIPPLLLIVFIENAFKHGMAGNKRHYINIEVKYDAPYLNYSVINSAPKMVTKPSKEAGIGLINLRKRLELIYKDNFTMNCTHHNGEYIAQLIIPIKNG